MTVKIQHCHFVRSVLSQLHVGKYKVKKPQTKPQKTNPKAFIFDEICAVLITSCAFPVFGGIGQEYFPTICWERLFTSHRNTPVLLPGSAT